MNTLGASAVSIYLLLLETWNENETDYFSLSDAQISQQLKLSRGTIIKHKLILRDLGLIQIQKKNGLASIYFINDNYIIGEVKQNSKAHSTKEVKKQIPKNIKNSISVKPEIPQSNNPNLSKNIPSLEEFLAYAKTIEIYDDSLEFQVKTKYESWVANGWRNGYDNKIRDWKISLKSTMVYMKNPPMDKILPQHIKRPKQTYNE